MIEQPMFWKVGDLPSRPLEKNFKPIRFPLWTQSKAKLIQEYLRLFQFVTKHGLYIDGFAAPQAAEDDDLWAARLVLETEPKWFTDFWLCDINKSGIRKLNELRNKHVSPRRRITVMEGDFNRSVRQILLSGKITDKKATFALLDQRTLECEWSSVVALSQHKKSTKIELFYFFPTGWIDRSLAAISTPEGIAQAEKWWGKADWKSLIGMNSTHRAMLVAERFKAELGYCRVYPYPIHEKRSGGRVMYHMIHATDHDEATPLMVRAYRKVAGRVVESQQPDLEEMWRG